MISANRLPASRPLATSLAALVAVAAFTPFSGCQSVYYATMEKFGVEKRDLLKRAVVNARDEQKEAQVEFKEARVPQAPYVSQTRS